VTYTAGRTELRELREWLAPEGGWLLVDEVMAMLGVSKQRVSFLVSQGGLKSKRRGHRLLIEEASVRAHMAAPKQRGGRPTPDAPEGWVVPSQAARLLGCTRQWVHVLIQPGVLRAREEAPHRLVVERATVDAYGEREPRGAAGSLEPDRRPWR
jgi:hypothetical protein